MGEAVEVGNGQDQSQHEETLTAIRYTESDNDDETDLKERQWTKSFGDVRNNEKMEKDVIRVATQNIGGFPRMDRRGTTKFMRMREETQAMDCVGWSEINRN